jgi:DNA-binding MarR family transcriptional regulator
MRNRTKAMAVEDATPGATPAWRATPRTSDPRASRTLTRQTRQSEQDTSQAQARVSQGLGAHPGVNSPPLVSEAGPSISRAGRRPRRRPAPRWVIARVFEADLSAPVLAAANRISNPRQISERIAMGRALWRELVLGFASQLGELRLSFSQLAALYILADGRTRTIADLAESLGRSPSATSRLVAGLVRRRLTERRVEEADRRQRTVALTQRGRALLRTVDRARAEQFLRAVRTLPPAERALIAMGVAALATHAISPQGRLIRHPVD